MVNFAIDVDFIIIILKKGFVKLALHLVFAIITIIIIIIVVVAVATYIKPIIANIEVGWL